MKRAMLIALRMSVSPVALTGLAPLAADTDHPVGQQCRRRFQGQGQQEIRTERDVIPERLALDGVSMSGTLLTDSRATRHARPGIESPMRKCAQALKDIHPLARMRCRAGEAHRAMRSQGTKAQRYSARTLVGVGVGP